MPLDLNYEFYDVFFPILPDDSFLQYIVDSPHEMEKSVD